MSDSDFLLTEEEANELVEEHSAWAENLARAVARAWRLDWRLDGMDGAALEALLFCARRYNPSRGIPFKGYARRRIHEAASDEARKSRGWKRSYGVSEEKQAAREVSAELFTIFPELREGRLPSFEITAGVYKGNKRSAIRQVLVGAALLAAHRNQSSLNQEDLLDVKKTLSLIATFELIHQLLLYRVYWEGKSLRQLAIEWEVDGLTVIREHKVLLEYLAKRMSDTPSGQAQIEVKLPVVRQGLQEKSHELKLANETSPFATFLE